MHSLEPLRPWKAEQLGGGYALSSWCERDAVESAAAVIAVSNGMKADVLSTYPSVDPDTVRVIHNGIDAQQYAPDPDIDVLEQYGVDPNRPNVVFVGRITRQKGVPVLLRAAAQLDPEVQLVLCAGQPDTPELAQEVTDLVNNLRATRSGVIWIEGMVVSCSRMNCRHMRSFASRFLFLVEQAEVGRLAQEILENLVALGVVGLAHVLVPRGARAEHLEHHPRVRVVLGLDEVHEDAAWLLECVLPHRLQLRLSFVEPVEPRLDGDNQEQGFVLSVLVAHEPFLLTGGPSPDIIVHPGWEPRWNFAACR